jgi:hypothetical protein
MDRIRVLSIWMSSDPDCLSVKYGGNFSSSTEHEERNFAMNSRLQWRNASVI